MLPKRTRNPRSPINNAVHCLIDRIACTTQLVQIFPSFIPTSSSSPSHTLCASRSSDDVAHCVIQMLRTGRTARSITQIITPNRIQIRDDDDAGECNVIGACVRFKSRPPHGYNIAPRTIFRLWRAQ